MGEGEGGRDLKWDKLEANGPGMGYFLNAKKCWLIAKPWAVRELFAGTAINVTSKLGHKRLGAALEPVNTLHHRELLELPVRMGGLWFTYPAPERKQ